MTDSAGPAGPTSGKPSVRVRFAPSPSGDLHVGNIRTALFDWAFARHTGGVFVLRIEDTDQSRVTPAYIASALETLRWLSLDWDEGPEVGGPYGPYLQSQRMDIYAEWLAKFLESGHAYYCYCSPEELAARREAARAGGGGPTGYDGQCRSLTPDQAAAYRAEGRKPVVRMRMPGGSTTFTDLVRGDDLLSSTPRQLAVYRAMGVAESDFPVFAHLPFVLGLEGQKLGKRYGAASISYYRDEGFLPEALDNYLALLGWSPGEDRESFTLDEMAAEFDLARVNKNPARFDVRKLEAINGDKIRELDPADFVGRITPFLQRDGLIGDPPSAEQAAVVEAAAPLIQGRVATLAAASGMLRFLLVAQDDFAFDPDDAAKELGLDAVPALGAARDALTKLESWTAEDIRGALEAALVVGLGLKPRKAFGGAVRVAVTGRRVGPPLFESIELLGRDRTLARLNAAAATAAES